MRLRQTELPGVYAVSIVPAADERGFFARTWDPAVAKGEGLAERFDYTCVSGNAKKHTLRGMHWQKAPHGETKLVRCTKGAVYDVVVDLRPESPAFGKWIAAELTAENHEAFYVPAGCAHGFLTLQPDSEVLYHIAGAYAAASATGARFDDKAFGIRWPATPAVISPRDAGYPDFA